jgi:glycosyltransferase involved in cell wall biosynthesis
VNASCLPTAEDVSVVGAPTISVCICTRNRPEALTRTLDSLRSSSIPPHQIVVSDDSTNERTSQLVRRAYAEVSYRKGPRRGLGANRNAVVAAATGDFVLFLDDDCLLDRDFLNRVVTRLTEDGDQRRTIVNGCELKHGVLIVSRDQSFLGYQNRAYAVTDDIYSVVMNAAIFPRSLFPHVKFDERLIYGYDEIDLTTRAVAHGYRIVNCPDAVNHHFPSPVNRDYYGVHASSSRIYVTFKRYLWTQRRPLKAAAYLPIAVCHVFASMIRTGGLGGLRSARDVLAEALTAIVAHARST